MKPPEPRTFGAYFNKLRANRIVQQTVQVNAARVVTIGLGFVGSVWGSRCLGPEKLGISGIVLGTITPLVLLINLNQTAHYIRRYRGYTSALDKENLITAVSTFKIVTSSTILLVGLLIYCFGHFPSTWSLALLAAFPFFFLTANAADWLLQCEDKFPVINMALMVQTLITTSLYLVFFRAGMAAGSDIVVIDLGLVVGSVICWTIGLNGRRVRVFDWRKLWSIFPILKEGRWFIFIGFAVYTFTMLEAPLVGWLYSLRELGVYRTSITLVSGIQSFTNYLPMLLYPRMLDWTKEGHHVLWQRQKRILSSFALFGACLSLSAFLFAPLGYHLLYGPPFQKGAYPFAILLTAKLMSVMSGILAWGMVAQNKERSLFQIQMVVAVLSLSCNLILIPRFGALGASSVNLLSEVMMFTLIVTATRRALQAAR